MILPYGIIGDKTERKMRHGSLFSGIGGPELAAEWMGWDNVFHCEWNKSGQRLLKQYWPESKSYGDITTTDFTIHRADIDVLTGGFPCQPFSLSGDQKGEQDERYLFPEMLRAARETEAPWIVGENVYGITAPKFRKTFEEICSSLEAEGYKVQPIIIPASAIGAWHERKRTWFVAYSDSFGRKRRANGINSKGGKRKDSREIKFEGCDKPDWESEDWAGFTSRFIRVVDGVPERLDSP